MTGAPMSERDLRERTGRTTCASSRSSASEGVSRDPAWRVGAADGRGAQAWRAGAGPPRPGEPAAGGDAGAASATDLGDCTRCKLHRLGRRQIVFGVGQPAAPS